ncbi:MAG: 1-acyl-sn-glycerol-3-phosphate acyltransferase [Clostridia bacterium]|nr:1-acyl-sn-glycerol-3-phosphate acyltransferase [Clostridia bacterium]
MLVYLFAILSAVGTAGLYIAFSARSPWWILPIFVGGFGALNCVYIVYLFITSFVFSMKKPIKRVNPYAFFMTHLTVNWLLGLFRVHHRSQGLEKLPNEPFVLVSNHRSDFDPMVGFDAIRSRHLGYISKEANFRIPIVGRHIYHCGFLPIDRKNPLRAARTIKEAARLVRECGISMGIYPEGTRSKTDEMLPFKDGAFLLAKKAEAPLVIMATKNTETITKNFPWRRTRVDLEILRVLDRETVAALSAKELSAIAREEIEQYLNHR